MALMGGAHDNEQEGLTLGIAGFRYEDLHRPEGLKRLHDTFVAELAQRFADLHREYQDYRSSLGAGMDPVAVSDLLVRLAPRVGEFVARLFGVSAEHERQREAIHRELDAVFAFRTEIVGKLGKHFKGVDASAWNAAVAQSELELLIRCGFPELADDSDRERRVAAPAARLLGWANALGGATAVDDTAADAAPVDSPAAVRTLRARLGDDREAKEVFARACALSDDREFIEALLEHVRRFAYLAQVDAELKRSVTGWVSFKEPEKRDFDALVPHDIEARGCFTVWKGRAATRRRRDGFALTDKRHGERQILYEVDHCIYCHDRDTDSCSKGMRNRKDGSYKVNPLGVNVTGCPLEEKISEMHLVKRQGDNIGALALIVIDNPMCPGTGHRICNDCMKGCIYQKTEPVDIPQIETNVLTDVLFMPYGFEIYSLLTRWNPLNVRRPHALPYHGTNALVVGLGPSGYTLAHYLLNEGFGVVGIDALKLEPLPDDLIGDGEHSLKPIKDFRKLYEDLDKRTLAGFGGVAEYGITVRWDKNFLKVIYLVLARRSSFRCYGGVRFGGTLTIEEAWRLGFHHIAIATGAGKPTIIDIKNNLLRGIRKASDFLMGLQLTGAAKASSLANLQVRLPAGVVGGGLTAIDTATELMAYYPKQVEKLLTRYERLCAGGDEAQLRSSFDAEELLILDEFLTHGRAIVKERQRAAASGEQPNFQPLIDRWGGVTLFYRKGIDESPAYRQNHEEIVKALEEGIGLAEGMDPHAAIADEYGHLRVMRFGKLAKSGERWTSTGEEIDVPLRSLFVAAGTSPNTIYEQEHPGTFKTDGKFFQRYEPRWNGGEIDLEPMHDTLWPKIGRPAPLTSYRKDGKYISFYGDNHPVYAGNVVKAMASAKDGYPWVVKLHEAAICTADPSRQPSRDASLRALFSRLDDLLVATVVEVNRLTPTIIEVIARAPMAAKGFEPGRFYRVQSFESSAPQIDDTVLSTEGIALTGAWVDKEEGLISLIALEMGTSSRLCAEWQPGDRIVVMGATGSPTEIPSGKTVLLAGGGLGNAVLFSIGKAMRAAGNRVIYFAGYRRGIDRFKVEDVEAASDVVVWAVDAAPGAEPLGTSRPEDRSCVGNILDAMEAYARGQLGTPTIPLNEVDHLIAIGSDRMMAAVKEARHGRLKPYLKPGHTAIGSINSPMQCMMKGVCAQCLCKHIDPESGEEYFVYSCYNQDQELDRIDFENLKARLRQNSVQEKISDRWLGLLLESRRT
jgi:NADPH-dependent glutamate synthase beta subunit-like oxidoreductase/NAD(P)H-flavin reductase